MHQDVLQMFAETLHLLIVISDEVYDGSDIALLHLQLRDRAYDDTIYAPTVGRESLLEKLTALISLQTCSKSTSFTSEGFLLTTFAISSKQSHCSSAWG